MCAALRFEKFLSPLLPRCDLGFLLRDSLSIVILADLGSMICSDFGTLADVSNFEEIFIGSHSSHPYGRQFRSLMNPFCSFVELLFNNSSNITSCQNRTCRFFSFFFYPERAFSNLSSGFVKIRTCTQMNPKEKQRKEEAAAAYEWSALAGDGDPAAAPLEYM